MNASTKFCLSTDLMRSAAIARSQRRLIMAIWRRVYRILGVDRRWKAGSFGGGTPVVASLTVAAVSMLAMGTNSAFAQTATPGIFINDSAHLGGGNCAVIMDATGPESNAIGKPKDITRANWGGASGVQFGNGATDFGTYVGGRSGAAFCNYGDRNSQTNRVLFWGDEAGTNSLTLGGQLAVNSGSIVVGGGQTGATLNAIRIGSVATITGTSAVSSLAVGDNTIASGKSSTALGNAARASAEGTTAVGRNTAASGTGSLAVGDGATTSNANAVALGAGSTTTAAVATASVTIDGTTYNFAGVAPGSTVSIGAVGRERTITNVAAGRISDKSTDGVNGSQLFASNQAIEKLNTELGNSIATAIGGSTSYNPATHQLTTSLKVGGTEQKSVQEAISALDTKASAGWSLSAQGANGRNVVPGASVDLKNVDGNIKISKLAADNNVTFDLAKDINVDSLTAGNTKVSTTGVAITGGPKDPVSLTSAGLNNGGNTITNVGAGAITAASFEAINGSQLWSMGSSIARNLGGGVIVLGDGKLSAPEYKVATIDPAGIKSTTTYNNVGDALGGLGNSVGNVNSRVDNIDVKINTLKNDALLWDENKKAYSANHNNTGPNKITDVAAGELSENSTDAVNGSQLYQTNQRVTSVENRVTTIEEGVGNLWDRAVTYDGSKGDPKDKITLQGQMSSDGGKTGGTTISNVKRGKVSETSTEAINGSQLNETNQTIAGLDKSSVKYDRDGAGNKLNSVTLEGGDPNAPVLIQNIAAGKKGTDAVNVAQLTSGLADTVTESKSYTDNRVNYAIDSAKAYTNQTAQTTLNAANEYTDKQFGLLNREIGGVRKEARQAAAVGLAAASLRYDDRPGKLSVAMGGGLWRDTGALAFGAGYTSESGRIRANVSGATAGGNLGVGAGLSFTLN